MIKLENVSKSYPTRTGRLQVFSDINLTINKGDKIGIIGRNGAGKSTLIRLISGSEPPTGGKITRNMTISWPLAFGGAFQPRLTGLDNLKFICRIYNTDYESKVDFVEEFSELGRFMREPVNNYSSGMKSRLAFAISLSIEFDCYLIDEVTAAGDVRFRHKCDVELFEKRKDRAMIMVSHKDKFLEEHCNRAAILKDGVLTQFDNVDEAADLYEKDMLSCLPARE